MYFPPPQLIISCVLYLSKAPLALRLPKFETFNPLYSPLVLKTVSHQVMELETASYFCRCFVLFTSIASGKIIFHRKYFSCLHMPLPTFNTLGWPLTLYMVNTLAFLKICYNSITSLVKSFADIHPFYKVYSH